jgi:hypothetical protein
VAAALAPPTAATATDDSPAETAPAGESASPLDALTTPPAAEEAKPTEEPKPAEAAKPAEDADK